MKHSSIAMLLAGICLLPASRAASISIPILDANTDSGYATSTLQTSSATGFYGMYNDGTPQIAHLFGVESSGYSRTIAQADIGFLNGATISSASLSFVLNDGTGAAQQVQLTGFDSADLLQYTWDAPAGFLAQNLYTATGLNPNSFDVTALVQAAAASNVDWLGLHLQGTSEYQWSYTYTGYGSGPDSAQVRLNIEYTEAQPVPEPATVLGGAALAVLAGIRARRSSKR